MAIERLTQFSLKELADEPSGWCATFYLSNERESTSKSPSAGIENTIASFEDRLRDSGLPPPAIRSLTAPLRAARDDAGFRSPLGSAGSALFLSSQGLRVFALGHAVADGFRLENRFWLAPLLRSGELDEQYLLLAVGADDTRLFSGSGKGLEAVDLPGLPPGLAAALNLGRPSGRAAEPSRRAGAASFSHGGDADRRQGDLRSYFRAVDRALQPMVRHETIPLVFAGVQYLFPVYRQVNTYPHLVETPLTGNPDRVGLASLRHEAERLSDTIRRRVAQVDFDRFRAEAEDRRLAASLGEVLAAARDGLIELLLFDRATSVRGRYDERTQGVELTSEEHSSGTDLIDLAVHHTLRNGGRVRAVATAALPRGGTVNALLRRPAPAAEPMPAAQ